MLLINNLKEKSLNFIRIISIQIQKFLIYKKKFIRKCLKNKQVTFPLLAIILFLIIIVIFIIINLKIQNKRLIEQEKKIRSMNNESIKHTKKETIDKTLQIRNITDSKKILIKSNDVLQNTKILSEKSTQYVEKNKEYEKYLDHRYYYLDTTRIANVSRLAGTDSESENNKFYYLRECESSSFGKRVYDSDGKLIGWTVLEDKSEQTELKFRYYNRNQHVYLDIYDYASSSTRQVYDSNKKLLGWALINAMNQTVNQESFNFIHVDSEQSSSKQQVFNSKGDFLGWALREYCR